VRGGGREAAMGSCFKVLRGKDAPDNWIHNTEMKQSAANESRKENKFCQ